MTSVADERSEKVINMAIANSIEAGRRFDGSVPNSTQRSTDSQSRRPFAPITSVVDRGLSVRFPVRGFRTGVNRTRHEIYGR